MLTRTSLAVLMGVSAVMICTGGGRAEDRITKDPKGRIHVAPLPTDDHFKNPWPADLEDEFWDRANEAIKANSNKGGYGSLYFENEKRSYPMAMMDFLAGNRDKAIEFLQKDDSEGYSKYTNMVDFYPSFTLKGQMRKYFYFGEYLTPAYREKMKEGAKIWTATDPLTRKHPLQEKTKPGQGFGPDATGVCVDTRNTDNLQAMRETAVYLMAEETGNEEARKLYADKLIRNVKNMYRVGMGEWDSNNYLGHTMTGYIQLADFAKDPQMKLIGKAAMDYMCATGALKYYRGGFGGPCKRDYNHPIIHGGSAADHLGLYFGDCPVPDPAPAPDNVHFITSAYRPPLAAVALARKECRKPVELLITHAPYEALRKGADKPADYETMYLGNTFTLGTLSTGTDGPGGDTNGFKLLAYNSKRGADFFMANTTTNPAHIGSAQYSKDDTVGGNNVAQYRNLAIWLNGKADCPFLFFLPKSAKVETAGGVTFIALEKTWLAIHPIHLAVKGIDEELTRECNVTVNKDRKTGQETRTPKWPDDQIISAKGDGAKVVGFALEVGEKEPHGDFAAFKAAVAKARLDITDGAAEYTAASGDKLKLQYDAKSPLVWRNGVQHDWSKHTGLYIPSDGGTAPIRLDWNSGRLHLEAGGHTFDAQVDEAGKYTFVNDGK